MDPWRVVVAVVVCCSLLSTDDVATLPLQSCSSVITRVDSLIAADQLLPADDLRLYFACISIQPQQFYNDDDAVRQLLALQPDTSNMDDAPAVARDEWSKTESESGEVCSTVQCLGQRAALTFQPCSRLTHTQCTALISVLENIISMPSDADNDATAVRLLDHFPQLAAHFRKWHQSRMTAGSMRKKRNADEARQEAHSSERGDVESAAKAGGNDKYNGKMSPLVASGGRRMRRAITPHGIPFQTSSNMSAETRAIVDSYLEWRANNGYGRVSGRWG